MEVARPYRLTLLVTSLLLLITLFSAIEAKEQVQGNRSLVSINGNGQGQGGHLKPSVVIPLADCNPKCVYRCSATSHKKPCMFFCQKCCAKCLCVPPGTYGNKELCPCYNNWKTKEGKPKCP